MQGMADQGNLGKRYVPRLMTETDASPSTDGDWDQ